MLVGTYSLVYNYAIQFCNLEFLTRRKTATVGISATSMSILCSESALDLHANLAHFKEERK